MSDQSSPLPPAGWYADPENPALERWWNGSLWGDQRRPSTLTPPIPPAPAIAERPDPYGTATAAAAATAAGEPNPYAPVAPPGGPYAPRPPYPNPTALVGFIISMAAILLNLIFTGFVGIAGGIVSVVGLTKANRLAAQGVAQNGRGLAIAGVIVGFVTGGFTIIVGLLLILLTYVVGPTG